MKILNKINKLSKPNPFRKFALLGIVGVVALSGASFLNNSRAATAPNHSPYLCGTWALQEVNSVAALNSKANNINSFLSLNDMRGLSLRAPWKNADDASFSLFVAGKNLADAKSLDYTVRFMAGRHTPKRIFDAGAYYYEVTSMVGGAPVVEKVPKPFSNSGVPGNPVFEQEFETYISKLATWARTNSIKIIHLPWYGYKWSEIYNGADVINAPGYSPNAWLEGHYRLIDIAHKYAGPDLAVEFPMSGHWEDRARGVNENKLYDYMISKFGNNWSDRLYVQGNGHGNTSYGDAKPAHGYNIRHAKQMFDLLGTHDWTARYDNLIQEPTASYVELYVDNYINTNTKANLQTQITRYKNIVCPAIPPLDSEINLNAPTNLSASPQLGSIRLTWQDSNPSYAETFIITYRKLGSTAAWQGWLETTSTNYTVNLGDATNPNYTSEDFEFRVRSRFYDADNVKYLSADAGPIITKPLSKVSVVGDLNNDNIVNISDLSILLTHWGTSNPATDFNNDGKTNIIDLSTLLANWSV